MVAQDVAEPEDVKEEVIEVLGRSGRHTADGDVQDSDEARLDAGTPSAAAELEA